MKRLHNQEFQSELLVVDGYGLLFRCFFAVPDLITRNGISVGAVNAFLYSILRILQDLPPLHTYYIVIAFDKGTTNNTFRHKLLKTYKANRPELPSNLGPQLALVRKALEALGICYVEHYGHEADDIIGFIVKKVRIRNATQSKMLTTIISIDKDLMQLVGNDVRMLHPSSMEYFDTNDVIRKLSVKPSHVPDYLGLIGDSSDNIPGVRGIGSKTASMLLNDLGDLDQIYARLIDIPSPRTRSLLEMGREMAFLSKQLATINSDIDGFEIKIEEWRWNGVQRFLHSAYQFLEEYEMNGLKNKIQKLLRSKFG